MRKAAADHRVVGRIAGAKEPLYDPLCFHCQQSAEKYLKALLEELGQTIPKTHDLDALLRLLRPHYPVLRSLRRGLLFLTDFAVDTRYPGNSANKRAATSAVNWAGRVRDVCRALLGIKTR